MLNRIVGFCRDVDAELWEGKYRRSAKIEYNGLGLADVPASAFCQPGKLDKVDCFPTTEWYFFSRYISKPLWAAVCFKNLR